MVCQTPLHCLINDSLFVLYRNAGMLCSIDCVVIRRTLLNHNHDIVILRISLEILVMITSSFGSTMVVPLIFYFFLCRRPS